MKNIHTQTGFTLLEIVIVIAIIGIIAAIAIPAYQDYISRAYGSSCLLEVKGYTNQVYYLINDEDDSSSPIAASISACKIITDATGWTLDTQQKIIAVAKAPSNAHIECDIPNSTPCIVLP